MNYCTICGTTVEQEAGFHASCLKRLFGSTRAPKTSFVLSQLSITAQKMIGKLSISGVQPKLSMKLNKREHALEVVAEGGEYIFKPQVQTYPHLPENENLCMTIAATLGIDVPPHALLKLDDGSYAYIIKRFDRENGEKIHQEDFQQITGGDDKYRGSYESIGRELRAISDIPGLDVQLFYERVLFNFIIGNGDAHLKNFSITHGPLGKIRLAPAYDIVSSKLVIPDEEDCALTLLGRKNKLAGADFRAFADYLGIPEKARENFCRDKKDVIQNCIDAYPCLADEDKSALKKIVDERCRRLAQ